MALWYYRGFPGNYSSFCQAQELGLVILLLTLCDCICASVIMKDALICEVCCAKNSHKYEKLYDIIIICILSYFLHYSKKCRAQLATNKYNII